MTEKDELGARIRRQADRLAKAERDRPRLLAQTVFLGTLSLLLVLPIVAGAYLGAWLDAGLPAWSSRWTVSLVLLGVLVGALNVYLFIRRH